MSAFVSFTLPDAQATPVNHVFHPTEKDKNGVFWWEDSDAGQAIGRCRANLRVLRPDPGVQRLTQNANRVYRVQMGLQIPRLETLGTASSGYPAIPQVNHVLRVNLEALLPENSAKVDRSTIRSFIYQALFQPVFVAAIDELESPF